MTRIKLKVVRDLLFKNYGKRKWFVLITSLFLLLLCSCQKSPNIIFYTDVSSDLYDKDELSVINEDYQDALNRCQKKLDEVPADSLAAAYVYKMMGGIYAGYLEDADAAAYYINKAIQIDERENNEIGLALDYNQMSKIYICTGGDIQEGLQFLEKAEQIYEQHGMLDTFEMAGTLINKGRLYNLEGNYEKAINYMIEAQKIYIEGQDEDIQLYIAIGQIYLEMKDYEKAKEQYVKAQKICESKNDKHYLAEVTYQIGWLYGEQEDHETAIDYYEQALEYFKKNGYIKKEALIYNNMAYEADEIGWESDRVIPIAIDACRAIEKIIPETIPSSKSKKNYKHNLKYYYMEWSKDESEEGFKAWYQKVVLEGKDWKE